MPSATPAKVPDRGVPVRAAEGNAYRSLWPDYYIGALIELCWVMLVSMFFLIACGTVAAAPRGA